MWIIPKNLKLSSFVLAILESELDLEELSKMSEQSLLWRSKPSQLRTWFRRWKKGLLNQHLYGRILKPSSHHYFIKGLIFSLEGSHANHSQRQEKEMQTMTQGIFSLSSNKPSKTCNQNGCSSKMSKDLSQQNLNQTNGMTPKEHLYCSMSLENWKELVTEVRGEYSQRLKSAHHTNEKGCLSWPTMIVDDSKNNGGPAQFRRLSKGKLRGLNLNCQVLITGPVVQAKSNTNGSHQGSWSTPRVGGQEKAETRLARGKDLGLQGQTEGLRPTGKLNPRWVETLMGLPIGWTMPSCIQPVTIVPMSSECLETELCQQQPNEPSESCIKNWPTPDATLANDGVSWEKFEADMLRRREKVKQDVSEGKTKQGSGRSPNLCAAVQNPKNWPTARVSDAEDGRIETEEHEDGFKSIRKTSKQWFGAKLRDAVETHEEKGQ